MESRTISQNLPTTSGITGTTDTSGRETTLTFDAKSNVSMRGMLGTAATALSKNDCTADVEGMDSLDSQATEQYWPLGDSALPDSQGYIDCIWECASK